MSLSIIQNERASPAWAAGSKCQTSLANCMAACCEDGTKPVTDIALLGREGSGKSSLCLRLQHNAFRDFLDPTLEDSFSCELVVNGKPRFCSLLDTAGCEDVLPAIFLQQLCDSVSGFMFVFAINSRDSFIRAVEYCESVRKYKGDATPPFAFCGNKSDLGDERQISQDECEKLAARFGAPYFETSAKLNTNVREAFELLVGRVPEPLARRAPCNVI